MEIIFSKKKKKLSQIDVNNRLAIPTDKLKDLAALSLGEHTHITVTGHPWSIFLKPVTSGTEWLQVVRVKFGVGIESKKPLIFDAQSKKH
ncbi:hypothetical protein ACOSQ3_004402 [Xanthoceras sorbifolium]